jgi:S-adenosylmethionine hydrolase
MIVLLTDFGLSDPYAGIMKGVIKRISPTSEILDLTHQVPQGNIVLARFLLERSFPFFQERTIFLAVVDPGVGTARRPLAVRAGGYYFVGPDNGMFHFIEDLPLAPMEAVELDRPEFHLKHPPCGTFHGRDIFAPAAAHLDRGILLSRLGSSVERMTALPGPAVRKTDRGLEVPLIHVDHFGNLIFGLTEKAFAEEVGKSPFTIHFAGRSIDRISEHYGSDRPLLALFDSYGLLEIAVPSGSAASLLGVSPPSGEEVEPLLLVCTPIRPS